MRPKMLLAVASVCLLCACRSPRDERIQAADRATQHLMLLVKGTIPQDLAPLWTIKAVADYHGLACVEVSSPLAEGRFMLEAGYSEPPENFRGPLVMRITAYDPKKDAFGAPNNARAVKMSDGVYAYAVKRDMMEPGDITLKEDYRYIMSRLMAKMRDVSACDPSIQRSAFGAVTDAEILRDYALTHDSRSRDRSALLLNALMHIGWKNRGVRSESLAVLGALGANDPAIVQTMRDNLDNSSQAVRSNAAWALGKLGAHSIVALEDLRQTEQSDRCPAVRHAARRAILRITGSWQEPAVHPALQEPTSPKPSPVQP